MAKKTFVYLNDLKKEVKATFYNLKDSYSNTIIGSRLRPELPSGNWINITGVDDEFERYISVDD